MSKKQTVLTIAELGELLDEMESDVDDVDVAILPPS